MKRVFLILSLSALSLLPFASQAQSGGPATFADVLRYYMSTRVDSNGQYDAVTVARAAAHRDQMPPAHIGPSTGGAPNVSGNWQFVGPKGVTAGTRLFNGIGPFSSRITAISYDPSTSSTIYVGVAQAGLWKTTDGGLSWSILSGKAPWTADTVSSLAVDPKNPKIIYAGTGDFDGMPTSVPQGIMKSTDGGATWANYGKSNFGLGDEDISKILIDPVDDNIVTCTTGNGPNAGHGGVFHSIDSGVTWAPGSVLQSNYSALDVTVADNNGIRTYWAAAGGNPGLLYTSPDQGRTWVRLRIYPPDFNPEPVLGLACSKVDSQTVYVLTPKSQKVFRTIDGGNSWQDRTTLSFPVKNTYADNWTESSYDYFLGTYKNSHAPAGEVLFCGLYTLAFTADGGADWVDYGRSYSGNAILHVSQHQFAVSNSDPAQVLVGNDGGVFKLTFGTWTGGTPSIAQASLNGNFPVAQMFAVAPHPTDDTRIASGANGVGSPTALGDLTAWPDLNQTLIGGASAWDVSKNRIFTSGQNGAIYEYDGTGKLVTTLSNGFSGAALLAPVAVTVDGSTVLSGGTTVYGFNIVTQSGWVPLAALTAGYVTSIVVCPSDKNRIYFGGSDGEIWMSKDGGTSWGEIDISGLPLAGIGALAVSPVDKNFLMVGYVGTDPRHVFYTRNADSATGPTYNNVTGTGSTALPNSPITGIALDPFQPNGTWFVSSDVGVFMTKNIGVTWTNAGGPLGMPNVVVNDMKTTSTYLYAATYGRGLMRVPLVLPAKITKLTFTPNSVPGGSVIKGEVYLTNVPGSAGLNVLLKGNNPLAATIPVSILVPANATASTFLVGTHPVAANSLITVTASVGTDSLTQTLTVMAATVTSIGFTAGSVYGGVSMGAVVKINQNATGSGYVVKLKSNNAAATPPASVTIPSGSNSAAFNIPTTQVATNTTVTITATGVNGTQSASFIVVSPTIQQFTLNPTQVVGGNPSVGSITMRVPAGASGVTVALSSNNAAVASPPATMKINPGASSGIFGISTRGVASTMNVTITATVGGHSTNATLTVVPASLVSLTSNSSTVKGGTSVLASINLDGGAPVGGATVSLSSDNAAATVPNQVTIPGNKNTVSFVITTKTVTSPVTANITAAYNGVSKTLTLTITQ